MGQPQKASNLCYDEVWENKRTGEIRHIRSYISAQPEKLFLKVYRKEYERIVCQLKGKEHIVFDYIFCKFNVRNYILKATFNDISKGTGVSTSTVARAMAKLQKLGFINYKKDGEWVVNSYILGYGDRTNQNIGYAIFKDCEK